MSKSLFLIFSESLKNSPIINKTGLEKYKENIVHASSERSLTTSSVEQSASLTSEVRTSNGLSGQSGSPTSSTTSGASTSIPKKPNAQPNESIVAEAAEKERLAAKALAEATAAAEAKALAEATAAAKATAAAEAKAAAQARLSAQPTTLTTPSGASSNNKDEPLNLNNVENYVENSLRGIQGQRVSHEINKNHIKRFGGSSAQPDNKIQVTSDDIMKVFTKMLEIISEKK